MGFTLKFVSLPVLRVCLNLSACSRVGSESEERNHRLLSHFTQMTCFIIQIYLHQATATGQQPLGPAPHPVELAMLTPLLPPPHRRVNRRCYQSVCVLFSWIYIGNCIWNTLKLSYQDSVLQCFRRRLSPSPQEDLDFKSI